jgi:DNA helicase HerA-like ATPase
LKARLEAINRDSRYAFMFGSLTVQDTMAQVLSRLFRIPVNGKPIAILELGGLPSEIINVVVSVLARLAFDFGVWSAGRIPITFVCEEAHRYVPVDKTLGFEPTKRAISRIAKEGRKYGISLCVVSQRPAELDATILSQCNTIFSMRLTNERDQQILRAGISDAASSLLDFMPTMGTGEAIAFGEGVALPTRIKFDMLTAEEWPMSNTASVTGSWAREMPEDGFLQDIVLRWRAQTFSPEGSVFDVPPQAAFGQQPAPPAAPDLTAPLRRLSTLSPGMAPPAAGGEERPSLANLIRQIRS